MTLEEQSRLSFYREVSVLNAEHEVKVVQHRENSQLFVEKRLKTYQREAIEILKKNPIPNMPQIVEAIEDEGEMIVIETYLAGNTLREKLEEKGHFPIEEVRSIGIKLCVILSSLHSVGLIHRDIKPENIIYEDSGIIKLLDMDAIKAYSPGEVRDTQLIGTVEYAAPEQYGFLASAPSTDIYSVGILLNELDTGTYPYKKNSSDLVLKSIVSRCIEMDPAKRYQSAQELLNALRTWVIEPAPQTRKQVTTNIINNVNTTSTTSVVSRKIRLLPPKKVPYVPEVFSPAPFATGAAIAASEKGWRRLLWPGFRTKTIIHMVYAIPWYMFITYAIYYLIKDRGDTSWFGIVLGCGAFLVLGLGLPVFLCNYLNIWKLLRIDRPRKAALCYLKAFLWYAGTVLVYYVLVQVRNYFYSL